MTNYNILTESFREELAEERFQRIQEESTNIIFALEAGIYTGKKKSDGKALVKKIINMFRMLMDKFRGMTAKLFQKYEQDIASYEERKGVLNFKSISVNADPNYINNSDAVKKYSNHPAVGAIKRLAMNSESYVSNPDNPITLDGIIENTPELKKYITNESNSIGESVKIELRYGKPNAKEAVANMSNIQKHCDNTLIPYCKDYQKISDNLTKESNGVLTSITKKMDNIVRKISATPVAESYIEIEDCVVRESCISMVPVLEAGPTVEVGKDEKAEGQQTEQKTPNNQTKPQPKPGMSADSGKKLARELDYLEVLASINNAITSSFMTVAEERFHNYIKIIRYILSTGKDSQKAKDKQDEAKQQDGDAPTGKVKGAAKGIAGKVRDKINKVRL